MLHLVLADRDADVTALMGLVATEMADDLLLAVVESDFLTLGQANASVASLPGEAQIPTQRLDNVLSTIGAGDNFNAGFVYGLVRDGITSDKLSTWPAWLPLIETGQRFSAHVCQRLDNYVDMTFQP